MYINVILMQNEAINSSPPQLPQPRHMACIPHLTEDVRQGRDDDTAGMAATDSSDGRATRRPTGSQRAGNTLRNVSVP